MNGGSGSEYMLQIPTCLYQAEDFSQGVVISKAAEGKDMEVLMRFFDFLYSEEGQQEVLKKILLDSPYMEGAWMTKHKGIEGSVLHGVYPIAEALIAVKLVVLIESRLPEPEAAFEEMRARNARGGRVPERALSAEGAAVTCARNKAAG